MARRTLSLRWFRNESALAGRTRASGGGGAAARLTRWGARGALFRSAGLLAIAALIPLLIFAGVGAVLNLQGQKAEAEIRAVDDARLLQEVTDQELARTLDDVQTLADSPALDRVGDLREFNLLAQRSLARHPLWVEVLLADPGTGDYVYAVRTKDVHRALDMRSLARTIAQRGPVIGDIRKSPSGVWGLPIRAPVIRDGKLLYIATIVVRPDRLQDLLKTLTLPKSWIVSTVNQDGQIIARSVDVTGLRGGPASPGALAARQRGGSGLYEGRTLDHVSTISAYWMSPTTRWSVHIGIPKADFEAPLRRSTLLLAAGLIVCLLLGGFFLALLVRDLEARRVQAAALEQAVRLEALGRLTGGVAHDFNNLLTVIQGNADILRRRLKNEAAEPYLDAIRQATGRAVNLIRQLLVFARGGVWETSAIELNAAVEASIGPVRQVVGSAVEVSCRLSPEGPVADLDPIQLEAAILNLAANARDAMAAGGTLVLFTEVRDGWAELGVADDGEGIPADVLPRVFDPFFTTKPAGKGTGLGLAQVYGLARGAGGDVRIETSAGQAAAAKRGTTVVLRFPLTARRAPENPATGPAQPPRGDGPGVLLVDDNAPVRATVAAYLRACGLTVEEAGDAAEALAALETRGFGALVTDIVMPGELDGVGLAGAARRLYPDLPILLLSGYGPSVESARAEGFTVLAKPVDLADLERRLRVHTATVQGAGA